MKSIFAAIVCIMRSMPRLIMQRVKEGGDWVMRLVSAGPSYAPPEPEIEVAPLQAKADEHTACIRAVAAHVSASTIPSADLLGKITEDEMSWLTALKPDMLRAVMRSDDKSLRDHLAGRKSLPGVLISDPATVREYWAAVEVNPTFQKLRAADYEATGGFTTPPASMRM